MNSNPRGAFCNRDLNCSNEMFCCISNKKKFKSCHIAKECDEPPKILTLLEKHRTALAPENIVMIVIGSFVFCGLFYFACRFTAAQMIISHHEAKSKKLKNFEKGEGIDVKYKRPEINKDVFKRDKKDNIALVTKFDFSIDSEI